MPTGLLTEEGRRAIVRIKQCVQLREHHALSHRAFLARGLAALAEGLGCDRLSVWTYARSGPPGVLRCEHLHAATPAPDPAARSLHDHPAYFDAIDRDGLLNAGDALAHPALQTMRASRLLPDGVRAVLDLPFAINGSLIGLLCAEQTGRCVTWQPAQIALMRQATVIGSLFAHRMQRQHASTHHAELMAG